MHQLEKVAGSAALALESAHSSSRFRL